MTFLIVVYSLILAADLRVAMSQFELYLGLGKDHILDYANGYDHILFVLALCAVYVVRDWKKILILITAFTVGHSITLALATLQLISVNSELIEFLIPVTIFITALSNLFRSEASINAGNIHLNYVLALVFGLIHGLGFSNYLRQVLGQSGDILVPLLAFNLGLEFGQLVIVAIFMVLTFIAVNLLTVSRRDWKLTISSAIAGIAFILIKDSSYLKI
jgi:hypothetical protein